MVTITEDYVSFEIAKLLKEKGFQQLKDNCGYFTTEMVYSINVDDNGEHHFAHQYPTGVSNKDKYIAAPTLQMTMKWLREKHNLFIQITVDFSDGAYPMYDVCVVNLAICTSIIVNRYNRYSYKEAVETAIKYCLENLV